MAISVGLVFKCVAAVVFFLAAVGLGGGAPLIPIGLCALSIGLIVP